MRLPCVRSHGSHVGCLVGVCLQATNLVLICIVNGFPPADSSFGRLWINFVKTTRQNYYEPKKKQTQKHLEFVNCALQTIVSEINTHIYFNKKPASDSIAS